MDNTRNDPGRTALAKQLASLDERAKKIREAELRLSRQSDDLAWMKTQLARLGLDQGHNEHEALAKFSAKVKQLQAVATSRGQQLQQLQASLSDSSTDSSIKSLKESISVLTRSLQRRDQRIADLQAQSESKAIQVGKYDEQISLLQNQLAEREKAFKITARLAGDGNRQTQQLRETMVALNQQLVATQDELNQRNGELHSLKSQAAQGRHQSDSLKKQLLDKTQQLGQIRTSISSTIESIGQSGVPVEGGISLLAKNISSHTAKLATALISSEAKVKTFQSQLSSQASQTHQLEEQASLLRADLQAKHTELLQKTKALAETQSLKNKQNKALDGLRHRLAELGQAADKWKSTSLTLDQQLTEKTAELAQNKQLLKQAEDNTQAKINELKALSKQLQQVDALRETQSTDVLSLKQQTTQQADALRQKITEADAAKAKVEMYVKEMAALRRLVAERDKTQQQSDEKVSALYLQLDKQGSDSHQQQLQLSKLANEIKQKDHSLAHKNAEIEEAKIDLLKREIDIQDYEEQLSQVNLVLSGLEDQLDKRHLEFQQKQAELDKARSEIALLSEKQQQQKIALADREAVQRQQHQRIESLLAQLDEQTAETDRQHTQADTLTKMLREKELRLSEQFAELGDAEVKIQTLTQALNEKEAQLKQENSLFQEQDELLKGLQKEQTRVTEQWQSQVATLEKALNTREEALNQKQIELRGLKANIEDQNSQLSSQTTEITDLKKRLEQQNQLARQRESRLHELTDDLNSARTEHKALQHEASSRQQSALTTIQAHESNLEKLEQQVDQQVATIEAQNGQIEQLNETLQVKSNELHNQQAQLSDLNDELKQKSSQLEEALTENREQHETLRQQQAKLAQTGPLFTEQESMLRRLQSQLENESKVAEGWRTRVSDLETKANTRNDEINQTVVKLGKVQAIRTEQTAKIFKLKEQISQHKAENKQQVKCIDKLQTERASICSALGRNEAEGPDTIVEAIEQLKQQISELAEELGQASGLLEEKETNEAEFWETLQEIEQGEELDYAETSTKFGWFGRGRKQPSSKSNKIVALKRK